MRNSANLPPAKPHLQYTVPIGDYVQAFIMYLQLIHKTFPMTHTNCMAYWLTVCLDRATTKH